MFTVHFWTLVVVFLALACVLAIKRPAIQLILFGFMLFVLAIMFHMGRDPVWVIILDVVAGIVALCSGVYRGPRRAAEKGVE